MERVAVVLRVKPGQEPAYREWLSGSLEVLEPVYARTGVVAKTVLMSGTRLIAHYECEEPDAFRRAMEEPESVGLLSGPLASVLALDEHPPVVHEEASAWQVRPPGPTEHAGLVLSIRPGQEAAYRAWLASGVHAELEEIFARNDIYRHDVLLAGTSVVAFYECKSRFNVLKAFREPESLVMLMGQLAPILDLDPHTPLSLFQEVFAWRNSRERQPA
jgi:hypothetical protein